jgi:proteic killer suppression protein
LIKSFADKKTENIWTGLKSRKLPLGVQQLGRRELRMLNNAQSINDLKIPPANRLKKMKENQKSFHSIRINNQYRIKFICDNQMPIMFK